jgi:hypothetical protein
MQVVLLNTRTREGNTQELYSKHTLHSLGGAGSSCNNKENITRVTVEKVCKE